MADYSPPAYDSPSFNTSLFLTDGGGYLTLVEGDSRYLRLVGGTVRGYVTMNNGLGITGNLVLNGQIVTSILTQTQGDARYLQLTGGSLSGAITLNRGNGESYISTNGTVRTAIHTQTSSSHIGTTSNHTFNLQANGANVLQCLNTGNVNVLNSLLIPSSGLNIGNNITTNSSSDIVIMESASTPQIEIGRAQTNGNSFNIGYTHIGDGNVLNRLFIQPRGASTNDTLTYTVNGGRVGIGSPTPTQKLEVNGNINVSSGNGYMIGGTSIDSRYVRLSGATMTGSLFINSNLGIGTTSPYTRLHIEGTLESSFPSLNYSFRTSSGNEGQVTGTVPMNVSFYSSGRVVCGAELDIHSDIRKKFNVQELSRNIERYKRFIMDTIPVSYYYKNEPTKLHHGYIAQDLIKSGFDDLTSLIYDPKMKANTERDVENPESFCFVVPYDEIIPIVALNVKELYLENESLKKSIAKLIERVDNLEARNIRRV